jgi:hypothetical protein
MPGNRRMWLPKSQVLASSEVQADGDVGTLALAMWFAEKEHLTDEGKAPTAQRDLAADPSGGDWLPSGTPDTFDE